MSRDGRILMEEEEARERWKELFEGLYMEADNTDQPTLCRRVPQEDGSEIAKEEVRRGVMRLKVRKAAGVYGIMPEMLKAGGQVVVEWLAKLFNMVWRVGKAPCDWRIAVIVPIHKKGSKMDCINYRGISLMSIVEKVLLGS